MSIEDYRLKLKQLQNDYDEAVSKMPKIDNRSIDELTLEYDQLQYKRLETRLNELENKLKSRLENIYNLLKILVDRSQEPQRDHHEDYGRSYYCVCVLMVNLVLVYIIMKNINIGYKLKLASSVDISR